MNLIRKQYKDLEIRLDRDEIRRFFGYCEDIDLRDPFTRSVLLCFYRAEMGQSNRKTGARLSIKVFIKPDSGWTIRYHYLLRLKRMRPRVTVRRFDSADEWMDFVQELTVCPAWDRLYTDGSGFWLCYETTERSAPELTPLQRSYLNEHGTVLGENTVEKMQKSLRIRPMRGSV